MLLSLASVGGGEELGESLLRLNKNDVDQVLVVILAVNQKLLKVGLNALVMRVQYWDVSIKKLLEFINAESLYQEVTEAVQPANSQVGGYLIYSYRTIGIALD